MDVSPEEIADLEEIQKYVEQEKTSKRIFQKHMYESVSAPLLENGVSRMAGKAMFHSVLGRTALFAMITFNQTALNSFSYFFAMRLNALVEFMFTLITATISDMVLVTSLAFAILIMFSIFVSVQEKAIIERMGGSASILEETEEDEAYKKAHKLV
jgi:hypothetical protein